MKATIKLYKSDGERNGVYPIKLIITHNGKSTRKTIGYSNLIDWNIKTELPTPNHEHFDELYLDILDIRKKVISPTFKKFENVNKAKDFLLKKTENNNCDFYKFAQSKIEYMHALKRTGNAEAYESAINELKKYSPQLKFEDITLSFLEGFKQWKKKQGRKNTTIRNYLCEIRAIYNACVRETSNVDKKPFAGVFQDIPIQRRRAKNIYIDKQGFKILEKANFEHKSFQRAVDLTLLQYYLGGQDLIDIYYIRKEDLFKDRVQFSRTKLGEKAYYFDVKIFPRAQKIIDKYICNKDKMYLFSWRKDRKGYKTFRNNHNRDLKNVFDRLKIKTLPKEAVFTSKAVRHSFATIAKFENIEVDIIRELMGHERNDIDTVYKDKYPEKIRDEEHFKIINTKNK